MTELEEITAMLARLRTLRDRQKGSIRNEYNVACDKLDILCSKIQQNLPVPGKKWLLTRKKDEYLQEVLDIGDCEVKLIWGSALATAKKYTSEGDALQVKQSFLNNNEIKIVPMSVTTLKCKNHV